MATTSASAERKSFQRFNPTELGLTGSWQEVPIFDHDLSMARVFDKPGGYVKHDMVYPRPPLQAVEDNLNKWRKNMVEDLYRNTERPFVKVWTPEEEESAFSPFAGAKLALPIYGGRGTITSAPITMKSPWSHDKKWKSNNGYVNLDADSTVNPNKQDTPAPPPPPPTITNNYATMAQSEKSSNQTMDTDSRKTVVDTKRNRYHDRKVSLRNPDTISLHSLRRAPVVPQRPTVMIGSTSSLGPLSQWQLTGENYIDSEQRKRHRALLATRRNDDHFEAKENRRVYGGGQHGTWETAHSGQSLSSSTSSSPNSLSSESLTDIEKPLRKPRERCTVFDRSVRIPRKKLVLNGPMHASSYSHWNSQVFPPPNED